MTALGSYTFRAPGALLGSREPSRRAIRVLAITLWLAFVSLNFAGTAPTFTSPPAVTFPLSIYSSFTITTYGSPVPVIIATGKLPGGVKFVDNGDGTATLSGRPGNGQGLTGDYSLTLTASNGNNPPATQNFTLTISNPPRFVSVNSATFVVGTSNTFTVKTSKTVPKSTVSFTGTLPAGVTFAASNNGTATLSGNPSTGSEGVHQITLKAQNGTLPSATQLFTLTVQNAVPLFRAPTIVSSSSTTFTADVEGTFTVRSSGLPTSTLTLTGTQPDWLTYIDNTDGTATIVGAPDLGGPTSYTFTITAANGIAPDAVQTFTLFILDPSPAITSVDNTTFIVNISKTFTVKTKETLPISTLSFTGTLPSGVSFISNTDGTASLGGMPSSGTAGTYPLVIRASNGTLPDAIQDFTLTVQATPPVLQPPAITSANARTFTVGTAATFVITTTGTPTSEVSLTGPRPSWLTYVDNGDGTATLSGTPDPDSDDSYPFTISAANGVLPNATQSFSLTVKQAPVFISPASATFAVNVPGSFKVETRGNPVASLTRTGGLPTGVSFFDNGDGTATIAGITAGWGSYPITLTAANGIPPTAMQNFILTIAGGGTPTPTATPSPSPSATPVLPTLANISTRGQVLTGDNLMIGGFIVIGSSPKKAIIRALGPSLTGQGVVGALADPILTLHQPDGTVVTNNNWMDAANTQEIIDSGVAPGNDAESAILMDSLDAGNYTAVVSGVNGTTGVALVEVYDLNSAGTAVLANISTRGFVGTSENVLIGGIIILGGSSQEVLIRAMGPSLTAQGVNGALADPVLELHDKEGSLIISNDNWKDAPNEQAIIDTTIPPTDDAESAIVITLAPDAYTAIVSGKNGTTGVALIEAYQLDN